MYRSLTWLAMQRGLALGDGRALGELARRNPSCSTTDGRVFIDDTDVTASIRQAARRPDGAVGRPPPRGARGDAERQRELAAEGDVVIEGRDIGTVVAPEPRSRSTCRRPGDPRRPPPGRAARIGVDALATDLKLRDESDHVRMQPAADASRSTRPSSGSTT